MNIDLKKAIKGHIKLWSGVAFAIVFAGLMLFLFSGENLPILKALVTETTKKEDVRESLSQLGWRGYVTVAILSMLQVVLTFLPAEPVQVVSGIAFGFLGGFLACLAGVILGNTVVFVMYRLYGQRLTEYFAKSVEFDFDKEEVVEYVKKSGGVIIQRKGATFNGVAAAVVYICKALFTGVDSILCLSTLLEGEYGINDVCVSIPVVLGRHGIVSTLTPNMTDEEVKKLQDSANAMKAVIEQVNI